MPSGDCAEGAAFEVPGTRPISSAARAMMGSVRAVERRAAPSPSWDFEHDEQVSRLDVRTRGHGQPFDGPTHLGPDGRLHLHRLDAPDLLPANDLLALVDRERHHPGHRRGYVSVFAGNSLLASRDFGLQRTVLGV